MFPLRAKLKFVKYKSLSSTVTFCLYSCSEDGPATILSLTIPLQAFKLHEQELRDWGFHCSEDIDAYLLCRNAVWTNR